MHFTFYLSWKKVSQLDLSRSTDRFNLTVFRGAVSVKPPRAHTLHFASPPELPSSEPAGPGRWLAAAPRIPASINRNLEGPCAISAMPASTSRPGLKGFERGERARGTQGIRNHTCPRSTYELDGKWKRERPQKAKGRSAKLPYLPTWVLYHACWCRYWNLASLFSARRGALSL